MQLRIILSALIIICCSATNIFADINTSPLPPLPAIQVENLGGDGLFEPEPFFEDAINQYKDGNIIEAHEKFRFLADNRHLINNPEIAGTSLFMTGHIMEELGLEGAALYFQQVITVYPMIADYALFRHAESVERKGNPAEAAELFKRVYDQYPDSGLQKKALLRASKNYLNTGSTREARTGFNAFMEVYPKDNAIPEALYSIGMSYLQEGKDSDARDYFRKIWVYHPVSRESRLVKTKLRLPLNADDTFRRGTSFYNAGYYEEAIGEYKRFLSQKKGVSKEKKKEAAFRIGMSYYRLRMSAEAEDNLEIFLTRYPNDEMAPEALYWLGRNYLRRGKVDAFIASSKGFLKKYRKDDRCPEVLYRLGNIYAERNNIEDALLYLDRIMREYPLNSYASDSLWKKGWTLYKAGDFDRALHIFSKIINHTGEHEYKAHAIYWRARILGRNGDYEAMDKGIYGLCSDYDKSFYCLFSRYYQDGAFLSSVKTNARLLHQAQDRPEESRMGMFAPFPEAGGDKSASHMMQVQEISKQLQDDRSVEQELTRIRLFLYLGLREEAVSEIIKLRSKVNGDKETSIMLAAVLSSLGEYNRSMYTIRPYIKSLKSDNGRDADSRLWPLLYPAGYSDLINKYAVRNNLDPFLVYAIIREESWFNKEAVSPAGALGLMQLMPGTAKRVAKESYAGRESLFIPEVNIELGTRFFAERLRQFDGNIFLAIASYNAGPEAVERWMTELGGVELDEFIEDIPYKETREYVKKVFRSYMEYHRLYKDDARIDTL